MCSDANDLTSYNKEECLVKVRVETSCFSACFSLSMLISFSVFYTNLFVKTIKSIIYRVENEQYSVLTRSITDTFDWNTL